MPALGRLDDELARLTRGGRARVILWLEYDERADALVDQADMAAAIVRRAAAAPTDRPSP